MQFINEAVSRWQNYLRLDHWDITVKFKTMDEDTIAEAITDDMYDRATIEFDLDKLSEKDEGYIERTVIHELLHCVDRDRKMFMGEIEEHLNPDTYKLWDTIVYQMTEVQIDRMASILYDLSNSNKGMF